MTRIHLVFTDPFESKIIKMAFKGSTENVVVGVSTSYIEATKQESWNLVDVCLCSMNLGQRNGIELMNWAGERAKGFVFVSPSVDQTYLDLCRKQGVLSLLARDTAPDHLEKAIRSVMNGREYFPSIPKSVVRFTPRELDVLTNIIEGKPTKEIADVLGVSKSTINKHVENMFHKSGMNNRLSLVRYCFSNNIV